MKIVALNNVVIVEKINSFIKNRFLSLKNALSERNEIKKISIINQSKKSSDGIVKNFIIFEILLNENFLNEKDIDLLDIEISYKVLSNNQIKMIGEFYAADGNIFENFHKIGLENIIMEHLNLFLDKCTMISDFIIKEYSG